MSWRILKTVTDELRRSENCRALAALEGWSYEGLVDPASQFKNHLIVELARVHPL